MNQDPLNVLAFFSEIPHEEGFSFRQHTTVGVGGCAPLACYPRGIDELVSLLNFLTERQIPYCVIGNGSNLLVSDAGFDGIVICTQRVCSMQASGNVLTADCGAGLCSVLAFAVQHGLGGAAFFQGIPATVGGAVYMNAGAQGCCMKDIIRAVTAWRNGDIVQIPAEKCRFSYKHSLFMDDDSCILSAELQLKNEDVESILSDINRIKQRRSALPGGRSMGCVFQNADGISAGALIEQSGCKGMSCGGAAVSDAHANFLINRGDATARDFVRLIEDVRARVLSRTGVLLKEEIRYIGVF